MTNYWYVARPNELFIDTDNVSKSIHHTRARLQGAIECKKLSVYQVLSMPSKNTNHLHTIITLKHPISEIERFVWEIILHGDIYRGCCNIMRHIDGIGSPDLLISPHEYFRQDSIPGHASFIDRTHDYSCDCPFPKHTAWVMMQCPVAYKLRGRHRAVGFFGKPSKNPCTIWKLPDL